MCGKCGCAENGATTLVNLQTGKQAIIASRREVHTHDGHPHHHAHSHDQDHGHLHSREFGTALRVVALETRILAKNDALAERNRAWLDARNILALNLMSAPGAGKTTLLERTIRELNASTPIYVLEGDQATTNDAERIVASGAAAVQLNTGSGCHLEANMVERGLQELNPCAGSIVIIENVGNLVCPALFDLGEHRRVAILSVTEGDDKPAKYPHMFRAADLLLFNKIDLLPYVDFDIARARGHARALNPDIEFLALSARTGEGMQAWCSWLLRQRTPELV